MLLKKVFLFVSILIYSSQVISQNIRIKSNEELNTLIEKFEGFRDSIKSTKKLIYDQDIISREIVIYKKALSWAKENGTKKDVLNIKGILLILFNYQKNYPELIAIGEDILSEEEVYKTKKVVSYLEIMTGAYGVTLNHKEFINIIPIYHKYGEKFGFRDRKETFYQCDIAKSHYVLKNYEKSIEAYKLCAENFRKIENYFQESAILNNVGLCFYKNKKLDSAKYYYSLAINNLNIHENSISKFTDKAYQTHFKNVIRANIAEIYVDEGNFETALPIFKEELRTAKLQDEKNLFPSAYYKIANVYHYENNINTSQLYLDSVFISLKKFQENTIQEKSLLLKAKNYLLVREIKKSNTYFDLHRSFVDSINNLKAEQDFMNSIVKYETTIKTNELKATKNTLALQEKKNNLQQLLLIIALFTAIILILFFIRIRKSNRIISKQKNDLEKSLDEKNVLLKEIHHRVKNNLQMVMSILEIQSSTLSDSKLINILTESQNRIHSIALIHEQLYSNNLLNHLELQKYIEQLINQISVIFKSKNKTITYDINISEISFSTDVTLILGMIINELISNIYKYAFPKTNEGFFSIEIKKLDENSFQLVVFDSGIGIDNKIDLNKIDSLGLRIVKLLVNQLKGSLKIENVSGTKCTILFSKKE